MKTNSYFTSAQRHSWNCKSVLKVLAAFCAFTGYAHAESEKGFVSLFDGQSLNGWTYVWQQRWRIFNVKDGVIVCPEKSKGNLLTVGEYSDFVLRLEYKLDHNGNNGVAIRTPMSAENLTYVGVEIQMLDDNAPMH